MKQKIALALSYPEGFPAPFVVAKEKEVAAEKLLDLARQNDIPIIEDASTCEVLSVLQVGQCIPETAYLAVAKIFAFIDCIEGGKNGKSDRRL